MKEFTFVPEGQENCSVKAWIHFQNGSMKIKQRNYPAVIICPGGAYEAVSDISVFFYCQLAVPVCIQFGNLSIKNALPY